MAGEIQLDSTTFATESSGSITAELDTIRPNTTNGSLTLQGDSSNAGVTGLTIDSSGNATFAQTITGGTIGSGVVFPAGHFLDVCHFQHTESAGTSGGTSSTSWATRTLNTTKRSVTWASLSSNAIALSAGTYWFYADPSANNASRVMARLYNNTDSTVDAYSRTVFGNAGEVATYAFINHIFTIGSSKDFVVQMRVQTSKSSSGYGIDFSFVDNTVTNVFMNVIIIKLQ